MKSTMLSTALVLLLGASFLRAQTPPAGADASVALPLKSSDVPRNTQIGSGPPAAGARIAMAEPADPKLPSLVLIGDSTVRNGVQGDGSEKGQWGWGAPLTAFFDLRKINLVNRAMGGTSSRSYYNGLWKDTVQVLKPGDVLIMQFGHNDNGTRGGLKGVGEDTQQVGTETVHSFGWYLRQYVQEARVKGATPIICSLIPRKRWEADGRMQRGAATHAGWAAEVAKEENVAFIDLNELIARRYDEIGYARVLPLFSPVETESVHTGWEGAGVNAEIVVSGLKSFAKNPLAPFFSPLAAQIAPADLSKPAPVAKPLPAGISANPQPAAAPAPAQGAMAAPSLAPPPDASVVAAPVSALNPSLPTIFIAGDSTAASGNARIQGWGVPFAAYFDPAKTNIANRARGGRSGRTFITEGFWDKMLAEVKPGDTVLIQFGHNDVGALNDEPPPPLRARGSIPGIGDETKEIDNVVTKKHEIVLTFGAYIRKYIADAKAKGATPIVLSLTTRDEWTDGKVERGFGHSREWSGEVAKAQGVAFIDLTGMIADRYEQLGREKTKELFPADSTHVGPVGADLNASLVVAGLKKLPGKPFDALLSAKGRDVASP